MKRTILIVLVVGTAGFLLGSAAGRGPFTELADKAKGVVNDPGVRKAIKKAEKKIHKALK